MNETYIFAGIVSYNPDIDRLSDNLSAISPQLNEIVIFDNGSEFQSVIRKRIQNYHNVKLISSDKNIGIAAALNRLMEYGEKKNYIWMLTLDQDSVCNCNYITSIQSYLYIKPNIGIVAPVIIDRNIGVIGHNPVKEYACVNTCITSGAVINIKIWKKVGKYDESMFIDSVDFEFCYRVRKNGYKVIQIRDAQLLHEIGQSEHRKFLFWKVTVSGHSAFRKYYIARNNVYYPLKHRLFIHFIRGNWRNLYLLLIITLYENDKQQKIVSVLKGWWNAYKEINR